ncbi:MAG: hypothetical protein ACQEVA_18020 [Myxococcota bacterium]
MKPRTSRHVLGVALAMCCVSLTTSCGPQGEGEFTFGTPLEYQECFEKVDPIMPTFYAARDRIDSVGVFIQTRPDVQADADLVHIEVYRAPDDISKVEGEALTLAGPNDPLPQARAALAVNASCPDLGESFELRGTVTFDEIGANAGDAVRGELTDGTVVVVSDDEPTRTVAEDVAGAWDFTVEVGAPYRNYPTFDDEYRRSP